MGMGFQPLIFCTGRYRSLTRGVSLCYSPIQPAQLTDQPNRYVLVAFNEFIPDTADEGRSSPKTTIPTFLALYIFAFIYQLVLVWDALRMKNTIQIIGLVGLNLGLLIYGAVQVGQIGETIDNIPGADTIDDLQAIRPILVSIPCILAVFTIALGFVAYKLYNEFAWTIYKHISADLRMKRRYLTYQIYIALLKFDFFFTLGFTIQFVVIVGEGQVKQERALTAAAIPVTIIIMLAAFWFTRRENLPGSIAVIILYFGGLAYFIFKMVRMYTKKFAWQYAAARKELTTFAVLTIALLICTIIVACMCAHNYGKGLEPYIRTSTSKVAKPNDQRMEIGSVEHGPPSTYNAQGYNMTDEPLKMGGGRAAAGRMEID